MPFRRGADKFLIDKFPGHDDLYFHAALGGVDQFFAGEIIGQKISILATFSAQKQSRGDTSNQDLRCVLSS